MERYSFKNIEKKWRNNNSLLSVANPKSERKGPDINNIGIKIIIHEGITSKKTNRFFIYYKI